MIRYVLVGINAAAEPNRITRHIPSHLRIIIPKSVVVKVGFPVIQLPRKPHVVGKCAEPTRIFLRLLHAKWISPIPAPDDLVVASLRDHARRIDLVGVDLIDVSAGDPLRTAGVDALREYGYRHVA